MDRFHKDPDAVLDYKKDWSNWLGTDTITNSIWFADSDDITIDSSNHDTQEAVVWLSGGTVGEGYMVTNRITTTQGRINDSSIIIIIKEK